jgi:hypothetical protein
MQRSAPFLYSLKNADYCLEGEKLQKFFNEGVKYELLKIRIHFCNGFGFDGL